MYRTVYVCASPEVRLGTTTCDNRTATVDDDDDYGQTVPALVSFAVEPSVYESHDVARVRRNDMAAATTTRRLTTTRRGRDRIPGRRTRFSLFPIRVVSSIPADSAHRATPVSVVLSPFSRFHSGRANSARADIVRRLLFSEIYNNVRFPVRRINKVKQ